MKPYFKAMLAGAAALAIGLPNAQSQQNNRISYPSEENAVLVIEQQGAGELRVGSVHEYSLRVRNVSDQQLRGVRVHQTLPSSFQVENESPSSQMPQQQQASPRRAGSEAQMGQPDPQVRQQERGMTGPEQQAQSRQQQSPQQQEAWREQRQTQDQAQRSQPQQNQSRQQQAQSQPRQQQSPQQQDAWREQRQTAAETGRQTQNQARQTRTQQNQPQQQQAQSQPRQQQSPQQQEAWREQRQNSAETGRQMQNQAQQKQAQQNQPQQQQAQSPQQQKDTMSERVWDIGMLGPREEKLIQVSGIPTREGEIESCVFATYDKALCTTLTVTRPELRLSRQWIDEQGRERDRFFLCDPLLVRYTIQNEGTGSTRQTVINEELPDGITTSDGERQININVGELNAGESETFTVALAAEQAGQYSNRAIARAGQLSSRSNASSISLNEAEIDVSVQGRGSQYIDRDVEYQITVKNLSNEVPARNTRVRIPGINQRMRFATTNQEIPANVDVFTIGTLPPGESRSFSIAFSSDQAGEVSTRVIATAYCAADAVANINTQFQGVPALQIYVVDEIDPVPVGDQTTYQPKKENGRVRGTPLSEAAGGGSGWWQRGGLSSAEKELCFVWQAGKPLSTQPAP